MGLIYRKGKVTLNFRDEKPQVWKAQQLLYPKITVDMLIDEVAQTQGITRSQVKAVIEALLNRCLHYMEIGHLVSFGSFGSFNPVFTAKTGQTEEDLGDAGETVKVKKIQFFPGGAFKEMLKNMTVLSSNQEFIHQEEGD